MKKLFTLFFLFALMGGVKADTIVDYEVDYSALSSIDEVNFAWIPNDDIKALMAVDEDEGLVIENPEAFENFWDLQYNICNLTLDPSYTYTVTMVVRGNPAGTFHTVKLGNWGEGPTNSFEFTEEFAEYSMTFEDVPSGSGFLMLQHGDYVGELTIKSIKVTHEGSAGDQVVWDNILENGDAAVDFDQSIQWDDQTLNMTVCAWGKENQGTPHPAYIEEVDGKRVFVVHATDCPTPEEESSAWDNQFWIQSPKSWKAGDSFQLSFRYKASENVTTNTQAHKQNPSDYLIWHMIGDINFTTEWQEFNKTVTVEGDQDGMWSVAFNLNPEVKTAVDFYFADLKWGTMSNVAEGIFITGDYADWNYANPDEFDYEDGDEWGGWYKAVVGTAEKPASKLKIATKSGNSSVYNQNIIKVNSADITDASKPWFLYGTGDDLIQLPVPGVWSVYLDLQSGKIRFTCPDYTPEEKEPEVHEVALGDWYNLLNNGDARKDFDASILYNDQELNFTVCAWAKDSAKEPYPAPTKVINRDGDKAFVCYATDCVSYKKTALLDEDGEPVLDDEGNEIMVNTEEFDDASAWDNQFWIQAPQPFFEGDEITVKFRYKCNKPSVKTNTQAHKQNPSDYLHWDMIGDVTFTDMWQSFEKKVTVNGSQSGMWSVAFNLNPNEKTATEFLFADLAIEVQKLDKGWFVAGDFNDDDLVNAYKFNETPEGDYEMVIGTEEKPASYCWISTRRATNDIFNRNRQWLYIDLAAEYEDEDIEPLDLSTFFGLGTTLPEEASTDAEKEAAKKIVFPEPGIWTLLISEVEGGIAFQKGDLTVGVNTPAAIANGAVEYYNLSGMRINKPTKGIAIEKRGAQTKKVLF